MSERGSFMTDYIYCSQCLKALKLILCEKTKSLCGSQLPSWQTGKRLPIIAGKIGGSYFGEEIHIFESELIPKIKSIICHHVRIVVFADNGDAKIFTLEPKERKVASVYETSPK